MFGPYTPVGTSPRCLPETHKDDPFYIEFFLLRTHSTLRYAHLVLHSVIDPLIKTLGGIYRWSSVNMKKVSCLNDRRSKVGSPDIC